MNLISTKIVQKMHPGVKDAVQRATSLVRIIEKLFGHNGTRN